MHKQNVLMKDTYIHEFQSYQKEVNYKYIESSDIQHTGPSDEKIHFWAEHIKDVLSNTYSWKCTIEDGIRDTIYARLWILYMATFTYDVHIYYGHV